MSERKRCPTCGQGVPFWDSPTIEEIAKLQGITGPTDLNALAGTLTEEETDALLEYLAEQRREVRP